MEESQHSKDGRESCQWIATLHWQINILTDDTPINDLWTTFKSIFLNVITKHVPTNWTSRRYKPTVMQPKNQEAFQTKAKNIQNIYKHLNIDKDRQRYKRLQRSTRQKRKIAYNTYVPDMVQEDYNCKKLYSFIKSKKCDCAVIAPLRTTHKKASPRREYWNSSMVSILTRRLVLMKSSLGAWKRWFIWLHNRLLRFSRHPSTKVKRQRTGILLKIVTKVIL